MYQKNKKYIVMIKKEGSTKIVTFMTPGAGSTKIVTFMTPGAGVLVLGCGNIVKMHYFFKNLLLYSQA